jgi:hypothetical protein
LPTGTVGSPYSQVLTATGSTSLPYSYAVTSGALPPGFSLGPATGQITGTPTLPGTYLFTVTATDADGCQGSQPYSIVIAAIGCPPILINPLFLPNGELGAPYSELVSASGGAAPYTYSVSSGSLPTGLALSSTTGEIAGTPTEAGVFSFTITATDSGGCPGLLTYLVEIDGTVTVIPTLSQWGRIAMMALLALAALAVLRRAGT